MVDAASVLVQIIIGAVPLGVAYLSYRAASDANRRTEAAALAAAEQQAQLERTKVDAEAFSRAKSIYEDALEKLQAQLDRVNEQSHKIADELIEEQNASLALRSQVRTLRDQIIRLERTVALLRRQLIEAGVNPAPVDADVGSLELLRSHEEGESP